VRGTVTVPDCRLDPATAHLWTIDVEALDEPAFASLAAPLSEEEQDRASRFRFPRDRRTFVAAHGLVRQALSWAMPGVAPQDWRFAATREGRPEIAAPAVVRRPRFNLSSSAGRVACVVTADSDCGVDLQAMSGLRDLDLLSGNVLAAAERGEMAALPDDQRLERFFRLWTLKEAYAKACGLAPSCRSTGWPSAGDRTRSC